MRRVQFRKSHKVHGISTIPEVGAVVVGDVDAAVDTDEVDIEVRGDVVVESAKFCDVRVDVCDPDVASVDGTDVVDEAAVVLGTEVVTSDVELDVWTVDELDG